MLEKGFIILSRKILNWGWYSNGNTMRVFIHLLLNANYAERNFEGVVIKRGSVVTSRGELAKKLRMSEQNVRTAIKHLESTGEITSQSTSKYTVFTIVNYDTYQFAQPTDQPTTNQQLTNDQPTTNHNVIKINKDKKDNKEIKDIERGKPPQHKYGEYKHVLLSDDQYSSLVKDFSEAKVKDYIRRVDEYCEQHGKGYKNYTLTIRNWIRRDREKNGNNENHAESKGNSFAELFSGDDI